MWPTIIKVTAFIVCIPIATVYALSDVAFSQENDVGKYDRINRKKIIWPENFKPSNSPIFVHNEIEINASPQNIWFWLTAATTWHEWYANASDVKILGPSKNNHLMAGTKFKWKTFGAHLESEIVEYVPYKRLAWTAKGFGILAYHAWLIIPTKKGCKVIAEETQHGWMCRLGKLLSPNSMYEHHQLWLEGLKEKSEKAENRHEKSRFLKE